MSFEKALFMLLPGATEDVWNAMARHNNEMIQAAIEAGELKETLIEGRSFVNVHDPVRCAGQVCVVHNPLDHHMRSWPMHWRDDRKIFERICPHGTGHPDPSQFDFWDRMGRDFEGVHGCDGCCRAV